MMAANIEHDELWKAVPKFPRYDVSNLGRVRRSPLTKGTGSSIAGGILKQCFRSGYLTASVFCKGKITPTQKYVHRLVAEAFISEIPYGKVVNHIDGDGKNNKLENLEIVTRSENAIHAVKIGRVLFGDNHARHKLTNDDVLAIRCSYWGAKAIGAKFQQRKLAKAFNVSLTLVSKILRREIRCLEPA